MIDKIHTKESPRGIIFEDFKLDLPIAGGWGYAKDNAVIINKNDPIVDKSKPFDGVEIEYIFVEKRIYEEMIIFRPKGQRYSGIGWKILEQHVISDGDKHYDKLIFEIWAFPEKDWEELKAEWEGPNGNGSPNFDVDAHERKRQNKMVRLTREFWFDVTSFYGQGIIIRDKDTGKKKLLPTEMKTYRDFPRLLGELTARDTVFRRRFDDAQRSAKVPFIAARLSGDSFQEARDEVFNKLFANEISEEDALNSLTDIMERYYDLC